MDSDNVDFQILDLESGYEKLHSDDGDKKAAQSNTDDFDILPNHTVFPWDKVEILMFSVVMILIVIVVASAITFTLSKLQKNKAATNKDSKLSLISDPNTENLAYVNQTQKFSFSYNKHWQLKNKNQNWLTLTNLKEDSQQVVDILLVRTGSFLTKPMLEKVSRELENYCQVKSTLTHEMECTSDIDAENKYENNQFFEAYSGHLYIEHKTPTTKNNTQTTSYILRHDQGTVDTIVIVTTEDVSDDIVTNLVNSFKVL